MTVKELISELEKIKNKDKEIVCRHYEYDSPGDSIGSFYYVNIGKVIFGNDFDKKEENKVILIDW